jgi:hypothetical protein
VDLGAFMKEGNHPPPPPTKNVMIFTPVVALSFKMSAFVQESDSLTKGDGGKKQNKRG